jgi:hypothetical protein
MSFFANSEEARGGPIVSRRPEAVDAHEVSDI